MTTILQPLSKRRSLPLTQRLPTSVQSQYGSGLSYPPELVNNSWTMARGEVKIEQSLFVILSTPIGARFMQPDFGSMLPLLVFARYDEATRAELKRYTYESIRRWEPRIKLHQIVLNEDGLADNRVSIQLEYQMVDSDAFFHSAVVPTLIENNALRFLPPGGFKLHGRPVF
jgi:phage baseplate assembly protein W